jgi:hypothetical protein
MSVTLKVKLDDSLCGAAAAAAGMATAETNTAAGRCVEHRAVEMISVGSRARHCKSPNCDESDLSLHVSMCCTTRDAVHNILYLGGHFVRHAWMHACIQQTIASVRGLRCLPWSHTTIRTAQSCTTPMLFRCKDVTRAMSSPAAASKADVSPASAVRHKQQHASQQRCQTQLRRP